MGIRKIQKLFAQAQSAGRQSLAYIREDIEEIISQNLTSQKRIEGVLDRILDCLYLGMGEEEFTRLNEYYAGINQEHADFYQRSYQEIVDEEAELPKPKH